MRARTGLLGVQCLVLGLLAGCPFEPSIHPVSGDASWEDVRRDAGPVCGNGLREANEECDGSDLGGRTCESLGYAGGRLTCSGDCTLDVSSCQTVCGNGRREPGEECDDGNGQDGDGCSAACRQEPGWYCSGEPSTCETRCGDGIRAGEEACDGQDLPSCSELGFGPGRPECSPSCEIVLGGCCGDGACGPGENSAVCRMDCGMTGVAAGWTVSCAVGLKGLAWCWGRGDRGSLGNGQTRDSTQPVLVHGVRQVRKLDGGGNWNERAVHVCGLWDQSLVSCWGANDFGQLGDGTTEDRFLPVLVQLPGAAVDVSAGGRHSCAVLDDGTITCWGGNGSGQLGSGTTQDSSVPVPVVGLAAPALQVSCGLGHTCAVSTDDSVACWGANGRGQLGTGAAGGPRRRPVSVIGLSTARQVAAGGQFTCALLEDGTVWCWGRGDLGLLGDGAWSDSATPVPVSGIGNAVSLCLGANHACAVLSDGDVWCWGRNPDGRLGDGTTEDRGEPVAVQGLAAHAVQVACGLSHTCALDAGGDVWCWGANSRGQLGDGTTRRHLTAVRVRW